MARYTGPLTKKKPAAGSDLVGNDKAFERRPYPPGMHGRGRTTRVGVLPPSSARNSSRHSYGGWRSNYTTTSRKPSAAPAVPATTC